MWTKGPGGRLQRIRRIRRTQALMTAGHRGAQPQPIRKVRRRGLFRRLWGRLERRLRSFWRWGVLRLCRHWSPWQRGQEYGAGEVHPFRQRY